MVRFLHTSDWQLGMTRHFLRPEAQARFGAARIDAIRAIGRVAAEYECRFVVVAGDVFESNMVDRSVVLRALEAMREAKVDFYLLPGNHDPLDGWSHSLKMPEQVHVFHHRLESVVHEKEGVPVARIHGISYPRRQIPPDFGKGMCRDGQEPFQIGLLHCNAGNHPQHDPYAPRTVDELIEAGLDYWALGHIHERQTLHPSTPFIGYPGNTQGRHIKESGPRGCLLVNVSSDGRLDGPPEFVPTDHIRFETCAIEIAGLESMDDLQGAIEDELAGLSATAEGRSLVVRVTITGRGRLHRELVRSGTVGDLHDELRDRFLRQSPFVLVEQLSLETRPDVCCIRCSS